MSLTAALAGLTAFVVALGDPRPPADDLHNFPPAPFCTVEIQHCNARLAYLAAARPLYPGQDFAFARESGRVERVRTAWEYLRTAHGGGCPRYWLGELRELLGPEAYYAGRMPSPFPGTGSRAGPPRR